MCSDEQRHAGFDSVAVAAALAKGVGRVLKAELEHPKRVAIEDKTIYQKQLANKQTY